MLNKEYTCRRSKQRDRRSLKYKYFVLVDQTNLKRPCIHSSKPEEAVHSQFKTRRGRAFTVQNLKRPCIHSSKPEKAVHSQFKT
ncbi:hypothetical protein CHS0354_042013 [Potamilus streckersoni]|uniref:Uncharacterized protein n=1 Tax=Potamilus streckersoni TaxID=2493646 RepID=A0AAE0TAQ7_9BIVA|nr:hypothetical protein CHS0354_042013 [Potamilus streckersoni]